METNDISSVHSYVEMQSWVIFHLAK
jgi:hypothetical protein